MGGERLEDLHHQREYFDLTWGVTICPPSPARGGSAASSSRARPAGSGAQRQLEEVALAYLRPARAGAVRRLRGAGRGTPCGRRDGLRQVPPEILDGGRISVAAMGVGLAQGAYDLAFAYANERQQFGKPISRFQAVQFRLADMATEIEAGRALVHRAAWLKDQERPFALAAAQAKLYTGGLSNRVVDCGAADPRRLRLHRRVRDLAPLPRPEDPRDRRGHERGAADGRIAARSACSGRSSRAVGSGRARQLPRRAAPRRGSGRSRAPAPADVVRPVTPDGEHVVAQSPEGRPATGPEHEHGATRWTGPSGAVGLVVARRRSSRPRGSPRTWHGSGLGVRRAPRR